jgi:hypothetical protein
MVFESPKLYDERYIDPVKLEVTRAVVLVHIDADLGDECSLIFDGKPSPIDGNKSLYAEFTAPHGKGCEFIRDQFGIEPIVIDVAREV